MMFMGLSGFGFGDASAECVNSCGNFFDANSPAYTGCLSDCAAAGAGTNSWLDTPVPTDTGGSSSTSSGSSNGGGGTAWYDNVITAFTKGVTQGVITPGGAPKPSLTPQTPWYMTPFGIIGIVAVIGGGIFLLTKK